MTSFRQVPQGDEIFLDHIAHWVPDMDAAAAAMQRLGFTLTPYTEHTNSTAPGEPIVPAGSANHCIMLREGYLEILTPTADTAISQELRAGIGRYVGVHLAAFGCTDAIAQRDRLIANGFEQRPVVDLRRETDTEDGASGTLQFTVIRPVPGTMDEGRIQFLSHHTPDLLWQERWMRHANDVERLIGLLICVSDPAEAARRYERYLGRSPQRVEWGWLISCERGGVALLSREKLQNQVPEIEIPTVPFIAGYVLQCRDLAVLTALLSDNEIVYRELTRNVVAVACPSVLGGTLIFTGGTGATPWGF